MYGSRDEADGPGTATDGSGETARSDYSRGHLTKVGGNLLQILIVLAQESSLMGDPLAE